MPQHAGGRTLTQQVERVLSEAFAEFTEKPQPLEFFVSRDDGL